MRVLIDARKIEDGGIGTYIRNLVSGLLAQPSTEVGIICGTERQIPQEWSGRLSIHRDDTPCYSLSELCFFPRRDLLQGYDLFHVPHYTLPFALPIPTVITVHDIIHVTHPASWYHPIIASFLIRSALRRADCVLTVSQATADALSNFARGDKAILEKIRVIPNAISLETQMTERDSAQQHPPYLLSVCSTAKPHKGTRELLEAFTIFKSSAAKSKNTQHLAGLKLKVVGRGASFQRLQDFSDVANNDVEFLGEVPVEELNRLYSGAAALVVASRAEGFCLPVVEAQARRVPVVSTPIPAVEDLLTSQDALAEDFSPRALAAAMRAPFERQGAADSPAIRSEYERHLARFDRNTLAAEVLSVYREVILGGSSSDDGEDTP